jgi:hypothetical protein
MQYWTLSPISPIYFGPTGTLLSRSSMSVFLFTEGLSLREMKETTKMFYNNVNLKEAEELRRVGNCNCSTA